MGGAAQESPFNVPPGPATTLAGSHSGWQRASKSSPPWTQEKLIGPGLTCQR